MCLLTAGRPFSSIWTAELDILNALKLEVEDLGLRFVL